MIGERPIKVMIRGELCVYQWAWVPLGSIWETSVRGRQGPGNWAHPLPSSFYSLMRVLLPRRPLGICRWLVFWNCLRVSARGIPLTSDSSAAMAGRGAQWLLEEEGAANKREFGQGNRGPERTTAASQATAAPGDGTQPKERCSSEKLRWEAALMTALLPLSFEATWGIRP